MNADDYAEARKAIDRVLYTDLGESRVRAGRDHQVLEAARWAAKLLAEVESLQEQLEWERGGG